MFLVEPPSKSLSGKDNTGADLRVLDEGQGRISVTGQGVDLPVRLRDVPRAAKTLTVIEGKFNVIGAVKMHDYTFEKPVASKEYRESIVEGVTVRIRTDFLEKNDLWSARVEYVYPEGGPVLESYEAAAWLLDNQIWLVTPDGKKRLDYNGGMEIVSQGERKAVVVYRFTDEAGIRMGKPEDWNFMIKTPTKLISTDVKFRLENIPLP